MSVDSLLQHIVLSQQHAQERRRLLHEVKSEFNKCHEKIIEVKEKLREAKTAQENKVIILLEKECDRDLLKKRLEGLEFQKKELLRENHNLRSKLLEMKDLKASEEETFMKDVWDYNNNYGLTVNRKQRLRERAEAEGPSLDEEIHVLGYDIEALRGENFHLNALHRQRNVIQRELSDFQETLRGLDKEISATAGVTKILEAEKMAISQRPQSDEECLRLKKELESYREENMESAYEALRAEIESLQQTIRAGLSLMQMENMIRAPHGQERKGPPPSASRPAQSQETLKCGQQLMVYVYIQGGPGSIQLTAAPEYKMMLIWTIGVFFFAAVKGGEVCYNRIGCFSDLKPWAGTVERPSTKLPWTPEKINTRFLLYTRSNQNSYQVISAINPSSISSSNFRTTKKTRFVIHGFTDSGESSWLSDICRRLFQVEDSNCICVDWSGGSRTLYSQASNNIRVVGAEIAYFVNILQSNFGYAPGNVHLIGHSLGAHTAGEAGKRKKGISRITGLDPAEPYFQNTPIEVRLDPSDATLVDVIHTDSGPLVPSLGFGMSQKVGHLDFFPNGGVHMPGCPQNIQIPNVNVEDIWNGVVNFVTCNHMRAIKYYTDSITNSNTFVSYPCASWNTYQAGSCKTCPSVGCPKMGHYADTFRGVTASSQTFYTTTP